MKFNDIIRTITTEQNITQTELGTRLGIRQNSVSNTVTRPNITLNKFITIMDILGYDVQVRKRDGNDTYMVTNND